MTSREPVDWEWSDLADAELLARLVQRGEPEDRARALVALRAEDEFARAITRMLA